MDDKLKEAWKKLNAYRTGDLVEPAEIVILDAYIEAEWQRRKLIHDSSAFCNHERIPSDDPILQVNGYTIPVCIDWTDADWKRELEEELER